MDSSDFLSLIQHYQTHPVPQRYNAAIVCASIAVSILGSYTTLLLLGRRTGKAGVRNFVLLVMAAGTMASVGIWGMHFIGMHMRLEARPGVNWYIQFNPLQAFFPCTIYLQTLNIELYRRWTIFSLFVPLVALACVFVFLGSQAQFSWVRVVCSGLLFGGIVSTMHYTAAFNANFKVKYAILQTVFSILLACSAATTALLVFFRWRTQWQDNWWKRLLCATILATGVSSMHYCAVGGTSYYVRLDSIDNLTQGRTTSIIMSVAISAMCGMLCLLSILVVISDMRTAQRSRKRARQIIVASATFDKKGNLLVTAEGNLPLQVVYTSDMPKDILSELDNKQPLFQWFFSLSWNWSILDPFADRIAARAFGLSTSNTKQKSSKADKRLSQQPSYFSHSKQARKATSLAAFRDTLLECTFLLAHDIGIPYHAMGLLFDKTIRTGTCLPEKNSFDEDLEDKAAGEDDMSVFSLPYKKPTQEGAMLVLVREVTDIGEDTVEAYLGRGFRFSDTRFLSSVISDKMGMQRSEVSGLLRELKVFAKRGIKPVVQPGGVYVGLFAARPGSTLDGGSLDTLVYGFARHQIPAYRLPDVKETTPLIRSWLAGAMGRTMDTIREMAFAEAVEHNDLLSNFRAPDNGKNPRNDPDFDSKHELALFQTSFYVAMDAMSSALRTLPDLPYTCHLSSEILDIPSSADDSTLPAQMIMFHTVIPGVDETSNRQPPFPGYGDTFASIPTFVFTPYSLFQKAQTALLRGKGSKDFAREVRLDLLKRYPATTSSPSIMDEVLGTPLEKSKKRNSLIDFTPVLDKSKVFAKLLEKKPDSAEDVLEDSPVFTEKVALDVLKSPLPVRVIQPSEKRNSLPAGLTVSRLTPSSLSPEDSKDKRRASAIADDVFRSGGSNGTWVTPPPAFPATALTRTPPLSSPPSFKSTPQKSQSSDTNQASRALLAAMGTAVGSTISLPGYRSPTTIISPPLVPIDEVQLLEDASKPIATLPKINNRVKVPTAQPLAAAARLRTDGWYERTMGEIEHSENARQLYNNQSWQSLTPQM